MLRFVCVLLLALGGFVLPASAQAQNRIPIEDHDPYVITPFLANYAPLDGTDHGYPSDRWDSQNQLGELQPTTNDEWGFWHNNSAVDNWLVFAPTFGDGAISTDFRDTDNDGIGLIANQSAYDTYYQLITTRDGMPQVTDGSREFYEGWRLYRHQDSVTQLVTIPCSAGVICKPNTGSSYHKIRMEVEFGEIRVIYTNATGVESEIFRVTDPDPLPPGKFGLYTYTSGGWQEQTGFKNVRAVRFDSDFDNSANDDDCEPLDPNIYPGAPEFCNFIDDDCDLDIDEDFDQDGDGVTSCGGDCNDSNATVFPGAPELCDGLDNDCAGNPAIPADEADADADGVRICQGDCDDFDANVFPGAIEVCNFIDDNCDMFTDEGFDQDGDGQLTCEGDCDDLNPDTFTGAPEICDGNDNNCDGAPPPTENDLDNDGFRGCEGDCDDADFLTNPDAFDVCEDGIDQDCDGDDPICPDFDLDDDGFDLDVDCDDNDPTVFPGAPEVCSDGIDQDCDGLDVYCDNDSDGWTDDLDCNDADPTINPGAEDPCEDGIDQNCNGFDDFCDIDADGWTSDLDCNDEEPLMNPGLDEICWDELDNDCDGVTDPGCGLDIDIDDVIRGGCACTQSDDGLARPGAALLLLVAIAGLRRRLSFLDHGIG